MIVILGIFVGIGALVLGSRYEIVHNAIEGFNALAQFLMEQLCRFISAFIFLMVVSQIWSGTFVSLLKAWLPLLLVAVLIAVFFALRVAYTSVRFHVPLGKLLSAMRPAMMTGLTTASSIASLGPMASGCIDELGVSEEQTSFGIPVGMILSQSPTVIMLVTLMMHSMHTYGMGADIEWYVQMALMCFLYSLVAPPVPDGMLICIGLLFSKLGIPSEALSMATAFYIIIDYVETCFRMGTIMVGVVDTGCALNSIDRSKFEKADEVRS